MPQRRRTIAEKSQRLVDEIRQLKKDLAAGKPGQYTDTFGYAGKGAKIELDEYHDIRAAVPDADRFIQAGFESLFKGF